MSDCLNKAFEISNLVRAWRWTVSNPEPYFKNYFRHIYRAYSLAHKELLDDLRLRLNSNTFKESPAIKIYQPKKSGIQRTITLISVEDQIVYQSLVNIIAEKLTKQIKKLQYKTVFSHIYAGTSSPFFYRNWKKGYSEFSKAIRQTYKDGYEYSASFDLTACYDTIDHSVLRHFLLNLNIDNDFCDFLIRLLKKWTTKHDNEPIYQGHGIPQGPLPSGLLSECVLRYFDSTYPKSTRFKYFRYVDDIRLFSKTESDLRKQLVNLDLKSKEIGLFPQNRKIEIHKIQNIEDELKSISNPLEVVDTLPELDQEIVYKRIVELTAKFKVIHETRFKHVLSKSEPNAKTSNRLVRILEQEPHLYNHIYNYFSKVDKLSESISNRLIILLKYYDHYPGFTAGLIRLLRKSIHPKSSNELVNYCKEIVEKIDKGNASLFITSELKSAALSVLFINHTITWARVRAIFALKPEWWLCSDLVRFIDRDVWGEPNYFDLINILVQNKNFDVALVSSEILITENILLNTGGTINPQAQILLKKAGIIGRKRATHCVISEFMCEILDNSMSRINWKVFLGNRYNLVQSKVITWASYNGTDASAWINLADTINDILLDVLCNHDTNIGNYALGGNVGGFINTSTSRFANSYPLFRKGMVEVHNKRLISDLSHPIKKTTKRPTRRIKHSEIKPIKRMLIQGYLEVWNNW